MVIEVTFDIPKELIDAAKNKKLVIFVGAGVSMKEGLPSWKELVAGILDKKDGYIEKAASYKSALEDEIMSPLEVLDRIESSKKHVYEHIEREVGRKGLKSEFVEKLGRISSRFVTTNFDTLLEDNVPKLRKITKDSEYGLTKIDTEDAFVLKLHGDVDLIDKCIVFSKQYEELYRAESLAEFQLKKLMSQFTVLFVGFSFNDKYVAKLFDCLTSMMNGLGPTHFIITKEQRKHDWLKSILIDDYSLIEGYIDELSREAVNGFGDGGVRKTVGEVSERIIKVDGTDMPPEVLNWVGREREIEALNKGFKVNFITGLGGQGKSALAAYYLESLKNTGDYYVCDWRDFKEEDHKFENKMISMISLLSDSLVTQNNYAGLSYEELIDEFFNALADKKCLFVLDNVDSYIDLEQFEPLGGLGVLFNKAITQPHTSKFIFTCRPFVRFASVDFFQLSLGGLEEKDVIEYFKNAALSIKKESLYKFAKRSYELTKGHPLWISLIVAQAKRGERELNQFLDSITRNEIVEDDQSSILSEHILGKIWASLAEKHKVVLRSLAESVQSLSIEDFSEIVSGELTYNKFIRSYKAIKNLGLVIEKAGGGYVELHPLVKEFIRKRFPSDERTKFIYMFIKYYDKLVLVLKPKLGSSLSFEDYLNWTNKIELYANAREYQKALDSLREIHGAIKSAGYIEEYLRVALIVGRGISWTRRNVYGLNNFDSFFVDTVKSSVEYGDEEFANFLLGKYESVIENKDLSYIKICEVKAYKCWFTGDFDGAIEVAEKANFLLKSAKQPENVALKNDYALALRDSGIVENMHKALDIFLDGDDLVLVCDNKTVNPERGGAFYGNIGRCLQLMKKFDESLNCFYKAFALIYDRDSSDRLINLGYAGKWISEALSEQSQNIEASCYFYKFSANSWEVSSPPLHNRLVRDAAFGDNTQATKSIMSMDNWRVESYCKDWVNNKLGR